MSQERPTKPNRRSILTPMVARRSDEEHRASTPLELLFDLCFVVAIAFAAASLHHYIVEGHPVSGVVNYLMVFFAIWWAWMNFSWFASSYDNDDPFYRLMTLVQIAGALVLAAGIQPASDDSDLTIITFGYVVMRFGTILQWLRAAYGDPERRRTALRYAGYILVVQMLVGATATAGQVGNRFFRRTRRGGDSCPDSGRAWCQHDLARWAHRRALQPVHDHRAG